MPQYRLYNYCAMYVQFTAYMQYLYIVFVLLAFKNAAFDFLFILFSLICVFN